MFSFQSCLKVARGIRDESKETWNIPENLKLPEVVIFSEDTKWVSIWFTDCQLSFHYEHHACD
jgi:hypothetical protein